MDLGLFVLILAFWDELIRGGDDIPGYPPGGGGPYETCKC